jgi:hypothetical protein
MNDLKVCWWPIDKPIAYRHIGSSGQLANRECLHLVLQFRVTHKLCSFVQAVLDDFRIEHPDIFPLLPGPGPFLFRYTETAFRL